MTQLQPCHASNCACLDFEGQAESSSSRVPRCTCRHRAKLHFADKEDEYTSDEEEEEVLVLPGVRDPKVANIMSKYQGQIRDIQIQTAKMQPHNKVSKTEAQEELRKGYRPYSKKSTTKVSFVS